MEDMDEYEIVEKLNEMLVNSLPPAQEDSHSRCRLIQCLHIAYRSQ